MVMMIGIFVRYVKAVKRKKKMAAVKHSFDAFKSMLGSSNIPFNLSPKYSVKLN